MKIIIADDEELVRESLKDALSRIEGSFEISEASNGRELISAASAVDSALCFADIRMPGLSGLEAIESIGGRKPGICWVILSGYSDFEYARKAVRLGAIEYLLKPASDGEIEEVVRAAEKLLGKTGPQPVILAETGASDKAGRLVVEAERLAREHFYEAVGVAQIAERLKVTPNYLSSQFKKYRDMSLTEFITDLRLEEARQLLLKPGMTVKEASLQLGYQSGRHFARLFRERYGLSPSDFQCRYRRK